MDTVHAVYVGGLPEGLSEPMTLAHLRAVLGVPDLMPGDLVRVSVLDEGPDAHPTERKPLPGHLAWVE